MSTGKVQLKVIITRKPEKNQESFFENMAIKKRVGESFIVEEIESAESGKQFLAKNPNYFDEVGVDPSSLQVIVLED
jgi:hypothetical protein